MMEKKMETTIVHWDNGKMETTIGLRGDGKENGHYYLRFRIWGK